MKPDEEIGERENSFLPKVVNASGETIDSCYQCRKCSAGCPVAYAMDILPHQIIRHIQYGHREKVLSSRTIWICASCYTCGVRCPNKVNIAGIMDTLRNMAIKAGGKFGEKNVPVFHSVFLDAIKKGGRVYELGLIVQLKAKTREFLKDTALGWKMFRRGKIRLLPPPFSSKKEIREIFNVCEKGKKG
jgi:heterodisulfide reductase subunit C